jgi:farnesyl diphosphate synthase
MGAVLGGATPVERRAVETYARALGLAFQIRDDLLDAEGDAAAVGKATGKDAAAGKATFVSLHGINGAKDYLNRITETAKDALLPFGAGAGTLAALLDFNAIRKS